MSEFTTILGRLGEGDAGAMDDLLRLVDGELRVLAAARLRNEEPGITLHVTELVNEAYLRLAGDGDEQNWNSRAHFFGAASEAMRRILVDHARRKRSLKRGGKSEKLELSSAFLAVEEKTGEMLAVHEALDALEQHDKQAAELIKLRYFVGMKHQEAADAMGISKRVADRLWLIAKTWLFKALKRTNRSFVITRKKTDTMDDWNPTANDIFAEAASIADTATRQLFLNGRCGNDQQLRRLVVKGCVENPLSFNSPSRPSTRRVAAIRRRVIPVVGISRDTLSFPRQRPNWPRHCTSRPTTATSNSTCAVASLGLRLLPLPSEESPEHPDPEGRYSLSRRCKPPVTNRVCARGLKGRHRTSLLAMCRPSGTESIMLSTESNRRFTPPAKAVSSLRD